MSAAFQEKCCGAQYIRWCTVHAGGRQRHARRALTPLAVVTVRFFLDSSGHMCYEKSILGESDPTPGGTLPRAFSCPEPPPCPSAAPSATGSANSSADT